MTTAKVAAEALRRHGPRSLVLDAVFLAWAIAFMVTGSVVPGPIASLFAQDPPTNVVVEPLRDGEQPPSHLDLPATQPPNAA